MSNDKLAQAVRTKHARVMAMAGPRAAEFEKVYGTGSWIDPDFRDERMTWISAWRAAIAAHEAEKQATDAMRKLAAEQKPLPAEFAAALDQALWGSVEIVGEAEKQAPTPDNLMQWLGNFPTPEVSGEVAEKQAGPVAGLIGKMTAQRAKFFLMRFRQKEAMLGPNEQAALAYAVSALEREQYAAPPSESDKEDAERYRCLKEMVSGSPMEGSYFFPGVDAWGGDVPRHSLSVDQAVDAIRAARAKKEQP